jgi:lipoprotein-anchoring transpeptidase ErfK/SrfK
MNTAINTLKLGKVGTKTSSKASSKKAIPFWKTIDKITAIKVSALLIVIGLIGLGAYRVIQINSGKILPKVTIAGLKVGGKTPDEAKSMVKAYITKINGEGPVITYENQTMNSKIADMGVTFNPDQAVADAYNFGRSGNWKTKVSDNSKMIFKRKNIILTPKIDEAKFDAYLGQIATTVEVAPVNAGIVITDGNISTTPPKNGRGIDKKLLKSDLTTMINKDALLNSKVNLSIATLVPDVLENGTVQAQETAKQYMLSAPIVVTYDGNNYTADKAMVGSWIDFTPNANVLVTSVSDDKLGSWVSTINKKIAIKEVDKEVMDGTGQVLNEGQDGLGVDTKRLSADIKARVMSKKTGNAIGVATYSIPKGEVTINPHAQPCRFEGHYIDVNLSEQTLYAFDGCNLVNQFLVSTGKTGPTPTGTFHVYSKQRVTCMSGPGYNLCNVEWVSWFSGDYSIHGTYWHNNFGHPMSHGCVNASNGNAEWIYNWDEVGTPVYIHW